MSTEELAEWLDRHNMLVQIHSSNTITSVTELVTSVPDDLKPEGVWYALGGSWIRFCQGEMPAWLENSPYVYSLQIDRRHCARLIDEAGTEAFIETFSADAEHRQLDWPRLLSTRTLYTGLEVSSYLMEFRFKADWYYAWDTESGVMWDLSKVTGWTLVAQRREDGRYELV